jgi:RNA polymerase sigma-70 factor (ECF subfamily)
LAFFHGTCQVRESASKAHLRNFFVSQRLFELPIPPEGGLALLDEDQKSLFLTWLGEHGSSVMKVARAYTLTNEECQDLAQEILLQAWRSLPKFEGKANVATWFYRVALLTAMNWHRKEKPRRSKQQPLLEVHAVVTDGLDTGEQAQQRERVEQVYDAIHQLPKTDAALVLLYLDELSYREMAEVLGISESNVGVKLNRATKALSELIKGESHGP